MTRWIPSAFIVSTALFLFSCGDNNSTAAQAPGTAPDAVFHTDLSSSPGVMTQGSGHAEVRLRRDAREMDFEVTFENLTSQANRAHIHLGGPSEDGPILFTLREGNFSSPLEGTVREEHFHALPDQGVNTFDEGVRAIEEGRTYVHIHTENHPAGEIRGQLEREETQEQPETEEQPTPEPSPEPQPTPAPTPTPEY